VSQLNSGSISRAEMMKRRERILAITNETERKKEIAMWVVDTLWDIKRKTPPIAPAGYVKFKAASPNDQRKAVEGGFWQDPQITDYVNERDRAVQENKDNIAWLTTVVEWLPEWDIGNRELINKKLDEISLGKAKATTAIQVDWNK